MTAYQNFKFGGVNYPLTSSTAGANLLAVCDPAVYALTAYLRKVIETHLGTVLIDVCGSVGAGAPAVNPRITASVGSTLDIDPKTVPSVLNQQFPLLAVWRKTSVFTKKTATWIDDASRISCAYILPALTTEQSNRIAPILTAVARIVQRSLFQAYDPSYNGGETILTQNGIAEAELKSATYDGFQWSAETPDGLVYRAVELELLIHEQLMPSTAGYNDLLQNDMIVTDESTSAGYPTENAYVHTED